ncbi:hypothetical protein AB205_0064430 [Aquarana catesbeiana]|uniref:Uncharacterized protein n=1 Tax=Aquarana catesbeiana TaxID=8400 RepID=A0A2G9R5L0_AQUCT|nr:hypothetical protein AB205_0064430 [Aquarana catesbeiana]
MFSTICFLGLQKRKGNPSSSRSLKTTSTSTRITLRWRMEKIFDMILKG